jgi:hypothetical protein
VRGDCDERVGRAVWETWTPRPYLTIHAGGPLDAIVTLTAGPEDRVRVQATWGPAHERASAVTYLIGRAEADQVAQGWANGLVVGREPQPD